jgi:hypothetical protein
MTESLSRADLPLPDYDHLPVQSLGQRIRNLDREDVATLLSYEREHAGRVPVVQVLEQRLEEVSAGAPLSQGSVDGQRPEAGEGVAGGSKAGPETEGPPVNPPSHGDPTNPAQPR